MTQNQWNAFSEFRVEYGRLCEKWGAMSGALAPLQKNVAGSVAPYPLENPVVYNTDLDKISLRDDIRLIVIGDNPGKEEQLDENRRYLVGQSGRIAEGFFRRNPELGTDFRRNVIIMNKTPVHTAKTAQLRELVSAGGDGVRELVRESQLSCARLSARLHKGLSADGASPELWLVGYSEMRGRGVFLEYRNALRDEYLEGGDRNPAWDRVFVYQHFSMNRFLADLNAFRKEAGAMGLKSSLEILGRRHREEIFGI